MLDDGCPNIIGAGGVLALYLVDPCANRVQVLASRGGDGLWSTPVFQPMIAGQGGTVIETGDAVVVTVDGRAVECTVRPVLSI